MNAMTDRHSSQPERGVRGWLSAQEQLGRVQALGFQYDITSTALQRMLAINSGHAKVTWERRRRDPIAPYTIALLFATPTGRADCSPDTTVPSGDDFIGAFDVHAANRVWLAGPEASDLPDLLYGLETQVAEQRAADGWVLREQLTTDVDDAITTGSFWVGIGVSSLDTPTGTWAQTGDQALSQAHVPGTIRILLNVASSPIPELAWIVAERRGISEYNTKTIYSTHRMSHSEFTAPYPYGLVSPDHLAANGWHEPILRRIHGLFGALHTSTHFTRPLGRPPKGSLWRAALDKPVPGRRS
ncbi:hypothetical protein OWR29_26100 [Actinoplanes sp. Pm04-4]|uniref:Uncharacterized protein n=1 Tax=Paractinoplanes pyxinae TaxID=2997416 RepID=A0ABT4B4R2_9ACTN|nr:hypothetical protein [Actinoplanes pyxinae]MCY1141484.1 hypothetical protein [Actinoplanes pyxinae]